MNLFEETHFKTRVHRYFVVCKKLNGHWDVLIAMEGLPNLPHAPAL